MVFKNFRLQIILKVIILLSTIFLFVWLWFDTELYMLRFLTGCAIVMQIYLLIFFLERSNRDLTRFLIAVKYSDFTQSFSINNLGKSFNSLGEAFSEVINKFRIERTEKEENFRYMQTIIKQVGVGLIVYDSEGEVALVNNPIKRMFRKPLIKNIDDLNDISADLVKSLKNLKPGERILQKVVDDNELLQLAISGSHFKMKNRLYSIVTIQDIQKELEEKEMEAWQNLIRVLTHEIMNSVTPISSLASTANDLIDSEKFEIEKPENAEVMTDLKNALRTIEKRSQGLLEFVNAYRNLTKIPNPDFQIFKISELFENLQSLMKAQLKKINVSLITKVVPDSLEITADYNQIEQIFINLTVNAIHALKSKTKGEIQLNARLDNFGKVKISIEDNGQGILKEVQEKIFIPFFSTKQGGSGIGLSLCKQVMRLHRGSINVESELNKYTRFTLRF